MLPSDLPPFSFFGTILHRFNFLYELYILSEIPFINIIIQGNLIIILTDFIDLSTIYMNICLIVFLKNVSLT